MGTDLEPTMRNKADQQLVEIDKKYTGFIHVSGFEQLTCICHVLEEMKPTPSEEGQPSDNIQN